MSLEAQVGPSMQRPGAQNHILCSENQKQLMKIENLSPQQTVFLKGTKH